MTETTRRAKLRGLMFTCLAVTACLASARPAAAQMVTQVSPRGTITDRSPTFTWKHIVSSNGYVVEVKDARGPGLLANYYATSQVCNLSTNTCSLTPKFNLSGGSYWWSMRWVQTKTGKKSAFTNPVTFVVNASGTGGDTGGSGVQPQPGTNPTAGQLGPSGTITDRSPTFTWKHVATANGYVVQVKDSRGPGLLANYYAASQVCNFSKNTCSLTPNFNLKDGSYWWSTRWIQTRTGKKSAFSNPVTFVVNAAGTGGSDDSGGGTGGGGGGATVSNMGKAIGNWPAGGNYRSVVFAPPVPLGNLRVYNASANGLQKITGQGNQDLLVVGPAGVMNGDYQIDVQGFRGIYFIGASFDPAPRGYMTSPNKVKVPAVPTVMKFRTSGSAVSRPFVYLAKFRLKNTRVKCCDFIQVGAGAGVGKWGVWPDIYRYKMKIDGFWGWAPVTSGTWGANTNHSDFMKFELGGVRHTFSGDIDVKWGYQTDFFVGSSTVGFQVYKGPDGFGEHHFWNYVSRLQTDPRIASTANPVSFFMVRGSSGVAAGSYYSHYFHSGSGQGSGVYVVPLPGRKTIIDTLLPNSGTFKPYDYTTYLEWPKTGYPNGRAPIAVGKLMNGARSNPPVVVREDEVGYTKRVKSAAELRSYIATMKSGAGA